MTLNAILYRHNTNINIALPQLVQMTSIRCRLVYFIHNKIRNETEIFSVGIFSLFVWNWDKWIHDTRYLKILTHNVLSFIRSSVRGKYSFMRFPFNKTSYTFFIAKSMYSHFCCLASRLISHLKHLMSVGVLSINGSLSANCILERSTFMQNDLEQVVFIARKLNM